MLKYKKTLVSLIVGLSLIGSVALAATLFPFQGGTGQSSVPGKGTLLVGASSTQYGLLATSTDGQILTLDSSQPLGVKWTASTSGSGAFTTTTINVGGTVLSKTAYTIATSGQSGAFFTTDGVSQIIFNMATATVFVPGFLSPVDFTTFNNKQNALNGAYVISLGGATGTIGLIQNLTISGNNLNTVQDIMTTSSPTFSSTTLTGNLNLGTYIEMPGIANPQDPPNGSMRLHGNTTQGITRLEIADQCGYHNIVNRDNYFVAKNVSGSVMATGTIVYQSGSTGAVPNVDRAMANVTTTMPAIGFAEDQVAVNGFGCFMNYGVFSPFDTSGFTSADRIYLSPTASGTYQRARPTVPNLVQRIGSILNSGVTNGSVLITIAPAELGRETGTISPTFNINGSLALTTSSISQVTSTIVKREFHWSEAIASSTNFTERAINIFDGTSTIDRIWASVMSNDTLTFNLFYGTSSVMSATSTMFPVFSASKLFTNTTTTNFVSFASSTPGKGAPLVLDYQGASTTLFHLDIYYHENQ